MDYLRVLLVPFLPSSLLLIGAFSLLMWIMTFAGLYGLIASLFLQTWMFKYCFFLIEHLADGAKEPPVMSVDMLSPLETRPLTQLMFVGAFIWSCAQLDGSGRIALACVFAALIPAQLAILGVGEPAYQAANPMTLFRLVRGLGLLYPALLGAALIYAALLGLAVRAGVWLPLTFALGFACEISFFALIGGALYLRRGQLGLVPSRSPERDAERAEAERVRERARMIDDVFQLVRIGRHVDATKPLADWIRADADEHLVEDARHIAEQALRWNSPNGLNTVGSTLIRYLMRAGRRSDALAVFERLRGASPTLTLDSAADLRALADYAESLGRKDLALSMRLETPVAGPLDGRRT
jgi:hypothetical protein